MDVAARVRELVEPLLAGQGFELVDVELAGATLRVFVDREGGIDLDALSAATTTVSDALDRDDPVPGRYTLEVSSPGVERPLRTPEHFRRFVGTPVTVKVHPGVADERRIDGVLDAADDEGIVVAGRRIAYPGIERARTRFEWGPASRPSPAPKRKKKKAGTR